MNVIAMFKEGKGICYYVNIASPTLYDDGFLKYIDYDLDVKLYPDGVERTLDENEYATSGSPCSASAWDNSCCAATLRRETPTALASSMPTSDDSCLHDTRKRCPQWDGTR